MVFSIIILFFANTAAIPSYVKSRRSYSWLARFKRMLKYCVDIEKVLLVKMIVQHLWPNSEWSYTGDLIDHPDNDD